MAAIALDDSGPALVNYRLSGSLLKSHLVWEEWGPDSVEVVVSPRSTVDSRDSTPRCCFVGFPTYLLLQTHASDA